MMKSTAIGVFNCIFSWTIYFSFPILSFALPREYVLHGYVVIICLKTLMFLVDAWNSDCTARNVDIARKSNIPETEIWGSALFHLLVVQVPGILLLLHGFDNYNPQWEVPTLAYFSLKKLVLAALMGLSTDSLFYFFHRLLHEYLPRVHLLHHCCVYSSQTTNLFLHPLDLLLEFTAPVLTVFTLSRFVLHDPWMFVLGMAMISSWYSSSHDELLKTEHWKHHRGCASGYFIYIKYFYSASEDESVRPLISCFGRKKAAEEQTESH